MLRVPLEGVDVVGLIPEAEDALILLGEVAQKGRVQEKGVLALVVHILLLEWYVRVVVVQEDGVPLL